MPLEEVKLGEDELKVPKLEPLQWCLLGGYVYFRVEDNRQPAEYQLTQTGHVAGVTLYRVRHVSLADLVLQGYQLDGLNAHDGAEQVLRRPVGDAVKDDQG